MAETKHPTEEMPDLVLATGQTPEPSTLDGYKQLTESLRQDIDILKKELSEVRSTMLMHMIHAKAKKNQFTLKSDGARLKNIVIKARDSERARNTLSKHEFSRRKREKEMLARREAAHRRLIKRRQNLQGTPSRKNKKDKTSVHPEVIHERLGTDAVDIEDYTVQFEHGPLGIHLEEIYDNNYSAFVAETKNNSQAEKGGLQAGDILLKIKKKSMEDVPFDDAIQTLMASDRPLNITFRRRIKVYCDHAEGLDGAGHMHGTVYSFDANPGDLGFSLEEMSNATLTGIRYDLCVTDVKQDGPAARKGLKSLDILVGINGDSVGGLGFEETRLLLVKSPRPMSLHFFRFTLGQGTIELGTDYLHEEVVYVLQYVDLASSRLFNQVELAKMTRKDEAKVKNLQTARHELSKVKERLVSLLDGGALHSDRDLCMNVLKIIRQAIVDMESAQAAVDAIGQAKLKSKKSFGRR